MADNYIDVTLSEIFGTGVASVEQTETSAEPGGYNVWTITLTNGQTSTFTVRNGTAGGSPMPVLNAVGMTDTSGIYLYLGNEEGYTTGHWYCYANDAWTDYGAYSEKGDPGLAPTVEISKTGGTTTITITDAEGEHVATIEDGISPTVNVANTAAEMTDTSVIYVYTGSETGYTAGNYYFYDTSLTQWVSGGQYQSTVPSIDSTLTVQGAAADSAKVGQEISALKSEISDIEEQIEGGTGSGLTTEIKQALLQLAQNVAYANEDGQTYYDALYNALYAITAITLNTNSISLQTIGATQQLTATTTPVGGAVAWESSDTNVVTVSETGLVTSVGYGSAIITATAGSVSATCNVLVAQKTVTSISAVYTQTKEVYPTDSLDKLESDLVVTANWSDSTTSTITSADYALSGTLEVGTSTITVSYAGKTTTFNVSVTIEVIPRTFYFAPTEDVKSGQMINDQGQAVANSNSSFVDKFVECFASATLSDSLGFSTAANRSAFYDADHTFLSRGWKGGGANTEKTLSNANASYAKLGWQIDGGVSPNYLLAIGKMEEFTISGKALNGSTGELSDSSDGDSATDYIEIDSSATKFILFTDIAATDSATLNKYVLRIVFYDNNKNRISYFNTYTNGKAYIGDIPSNASYFRASAPTEQMNCGFPIMLEH